MYEAFYRLSSDPFKLLPDPGICFPHRSCAKAWAYLRYALKRGEGIVVVTGPPGSGKTTLAERLLNELNPAHTVSVRLIANDLNPTDLLRKLAYSFGLPAEGMDRALLAHRIERYLIELEHGNRQALVLIDEAQTLSHQSLEAMRLLTDLQSRSRPVLQLFLLGQEGLEGVMCAPGMVQFQQRVIASCRLDMMDLAETKAYIEYRLAFADWQGDPSINGPAVMAVFRFSQGLPRHVNKICSRLLLHGCTEEKHSLKQRDVLAVVQDLREELLAPIDDDFELTVDDIAGTVFSSVDELALVPTPPSPTEEKPASHDELNALFLAEEQVRDGDGSGVSPGRSDAGQGKRWHRASGRYFYREGYPRAYRFRRWVYRLFQILGLFGGRTKEWAREWVAVVRGALRSVGRSLMVSTARAGVLSRGWISDGRAVAGRLGERMRSVSTATVAGLGGLLVIGLAAMVLWNHDGALQQSVAGAETKNSRHSALPFLAGTAATSSPLVLDGLPPQYLDVGALPVGAEADIAGRLDPGEILPRAAAEFDPLGYLHGMNGESGLLLVGGLTGNAADALVRRAVNAVSTLNTWSLANRVSEATDDRPATPKAAAGVSADDGSGPAIVAKALEERPVQVARVADDKTAVTVTEAPVWNQVVEDEMAVGKSEIERLLAHADLAMKKDWLLWPKKDAAYSHLQAVLAIDPQNQEALSGLDRIVGRYAQMAKRALGQESFDRAKRFVTRALWVDPGNADILELRKQINDAIAELEAVELAAAARMAGEVTQPEPIAGPIAEPENNFSRLMRLIEGEN